jgi:hypothetical protein
MIRLYPSNNLSPVAYPRQPQLPFTSRLLPFTCPAAAEATFRLLPFASHLCGIELIFAYCNTCRQLNFHFQNNLLMPAG